MPPCAKSNWHRSASPPASAARAPAPRPPSPAGPRRVGGQRWCQFAQGGRHHQPRRRRGDRQPVGDVRGQHAQAVAVGVVAAHGDVDGGERIGVGRRRCVERDGSDGGRGRARRLRRRLGSFGVDRLERGLGVRLCGIGIADGGDRRRRFKRQAQLRRQQMAAAVLVSRHAVEHEADPGAVGDHQRARLRFARCAPAVRGRGAQARAERDMALLRVLHQPVFHQVGQGQAQLGQCQRRHRCRHQQHVGGGQHQHEPVGGGQFIDARGTFAQDPLRPLCAFLAHQRERHGRERALRPAFGRLDGPVRQAHVQGGRQTAPRIRVKTLPSGNAGLRKNPRC